MLGMVLHLQMTFPEAALVVAQMQSVAGTHFNLKLSETVI